MDSHGCGGRSHDSRTHHASTIGEKDPRPIFSLPSSVIHSFAISLRISPSQPARRALSRCTVPETPLSSTGPISPNAIPCSCEASATAWLTSTSPCRA